MINKSKIRLSRTLHARTTPYPRINRFFKYIALAVIFAAFGAVVILTKPGQPATPSPESPQPKQILGEQESESAYTFYEVKKGDTLFNLSQRYNISWETLAQLNAIKEPFVLKSGQKLKIPSPN